MSALEPAGDSAGSQSGPEVGASEGVATAGDGFTAAGDGSSLVPVQDPTALVAGLPDEVRDVLAAATPEELEALAGATPEELQQQLALLQRQGQLDARQLAALADEDNQTYQQALASAVREQYPDNCSVHVSGLEGTDEIWPEMLANHFMSCGEVKRVIIKVNRETGERMGFSYVDFADQASAEAALALDGSDFAGRTIKVNKKRPKEQYNNDMWGKNSWLGKGKMGSGKSAKGYGKFCGKGSWGWPAQAAWNWAAQWAAGGPWCGKGCGKWGPY